MTCPTLVPSSDAMVLMLSGLEGHAASSSSSLRLILTTRSYSASGSAASGIQSASLPCAARNSRVMASDGKMEQVTPSSAPMLVIVARWGTVSVPTPSPKYSTMQPTFPFVERISSIFRMMSFAETQFRSFPVSSTPMILGNARRNGCPAMARATSSPPAPIAIMPIPPPVGVCESDPSSVFPGTP